MEAIVIGYDGSAAAQAAIDWVGDRVATRSASVGIVAAAGVFAAAQERPDDGLDSVAQRLRDRAPDCEVVTAAVPGSMPGALFNRAAAADLLVIGAHRGRPLRSAATGWLPLRAAARTPVPLVVVPSEWRPTSGGVVVGVDDDDSSEAAVRFAADEAAAAGTPLTVVHSWVTPVPRMERGAALLASPIETRTVHRRVLRRAIDAIAALHPELAPRAMLVHDVPGAAVLQAVPDATLVVLGTHHRGPLAGALLGSAAQNVLRVAEVPVCIVPGPVADGSGSEGVDSARAVRVDH